MVEDPYYINVKIQVTVEKNEIWLRVLFQLKVKKIPYHS